MTDGNDMHPAADEELLARYVLGRMDSEERVKMDRHIAGCETCARAVRAEMRIAAGARRLGRDDLKKVLRTRLEESPFQSLWPAMAAAAAVVAIVTGIGIYSRWFTSPTPSLPTASVEKATPRTGDTRGQKPPARGTAAHARAEKEEEVRQKPGELTDSKAEGGASPASSSAERGTPRLSPAFRDALTRKEPAASASAAGVASENSLRAPDTLWTEGIVNYPPPAAVSGEERRIAWQSAAAKDVMKDAAPAGAQMKGALEAGRVGAQFTLRQQQSNTLPAFRQTIRRQADDRQRIETRVVKRGDATMLTLYLDSLLDEKDIQSAQVRALDGDSLLVTIGNRQVAYKLPAGYSAQQQKSK